jgi:hypothetical protein
VAGILLIALLVAGGFAIHRLGWSQGYAAAEVTAEDEETPTLPLVPPMAQPYWQPVGFTSGGLLLSLLLGLILLAFAAKLLRVVIWGAMAGPALCHPTVRGSQRPGQAFTREQLLDRLRGVAYDGYDRSIDAHVKNLRQKIEPDPGNPRYVLTVYGVGYRLTDEV